MYKINVHNMSDVRSYAVILTEGLYSHKSARLIKLGYLANDFCRSFGDEEEDDAHDRDLIGEARDTWRPTT